MRLMIIAAHRTLLPGRMPCPQANDRVAVRTPPVTLYRRTGQRGLASPLAAASSWDGIRTFRHQKSLRLIDHRKT